MIDVRADIHSCRDCPRLVAWREEAAAHPPSSHAGEAYWARPLAGFGDEEAAIVLVGLAPAARGGNRTGRMFTGDRSGDFLYASLHRAGLANQPESRSLDDGLELRGCFVTAAVRCAPPANRPAPEERDRCAPYLAEELQLLSGAVVYVALGGFAYDALGRVLRRLLEVGAPVVGRRPGFGHGVELELTGSDRRRRYVVCSYHPSQRNTFTGLLTPAMLDSVLERAKELAGIS